MVRYFQSNNINLILDVNKVPKNLLHKIFGNHTEIKSLFEKKLGDELFKKLIEVGPQKFLPKTKKTDDNISGSVKKISGVKKDEKITELEEYKDIRQESFDPGNKYEFPNLPIQPKKQEKSKKVKRLDSAAASFKKLSVPKKDDDLLKKDYLKKEETKRELEEYKDVRQDYKDVRQDNKVVIQDYKVVMQDYKVVMQDYKVVKKDYKETVDNEDKNDFPILPIQIQPKKQEKIKQLKSLNSAWGKQNSNPYTYIEPKIGKQKIEEEEFPSLKEDNISQIESNYFTYTLIINSF